MDRTKVDVELLARRYAEGFHVMTDKHDADEFRILKNLLVVFADEVILNSNRPLAVEEAKRPS